MLFLFLFKEFDNLKVIQRVNNYSSSNSANEQISSANPTTTPPLTKSEAKSKAQALLALLPGETAFSKTAYATMGTGLGAFLISQGIYIPNDETLVLVAFALTTRALYTKLSGPLSEYLEKSIQVNINGFKCVYRKHLIFLLLGITGHLDVVEHR